MIPIPLQISWFVDYAPDWLGPVLMLIGITLTSQGVTLRTVADESLSDIFQDFSPGFLLVIIGVGLFLISSFISYTYLVAFVLLLIGHWLQGIGTVRTIAKLLLFFSDSGSGDLTKKVKRRFIFAVLGFSVIAFATWAVFWIVVFGPFAETKVYEITVVWTVVVGLMATLGFVRKYSSISLMSQDQPLILTLVSGVLIAVVGAQLYNFELLKLVIDTQYARFNISLIDPLALLIGQIVYFVGIYWASTRLLSDI